MIKQLVVDLCVEIPECNIDPEALLLQTVRVIANQAKVVEERVINMDEEYKAHIMEPETREPMMPPKQRDVRVEEHKATLAMIVLHLEDTQKLLDDTTYAWSTIEEIPDLMIVSEEVQKTQ